MADIAWTPSAVGELRNLSPTDEDVRQISYTLRSITEQPELAVPAPFASAGEKRLYLATTRDHRWGLVFLWEGPRQLFVVAVYRGETP